MKLPTKAPAVLIAMALAACNPGLTTPDEQRVIGVVERHSDTLHLTVPDSVLVGELFEVEVQTFGGGCERQGYTDLIHTPGGVTVTPYDYTHRHAGFNCADVERRFPHVAEVRLTVPGTWTVSLVGFSDRTDRVETFLRSIVVQ